MYSVETSITGYAGHARDALARCVGTATARGWRVVRAEADTISDFLPAPRRRRVAIAVEGPASRGVFEDAIAEALGDRGIGETLAAGAPSGVVALGEASGRAGEFGRGVGKEIKPALDKIGTAAGVGAGVWILYMAGMLAVFAFVGWNVAKGARG